MENIASSPDIASSLLRHVIYFWWNLDNHLCEVSLSKKFFRALFVKVLGQMSDTLNTESDLASLRVGGIHWFAISFTPVASSHRFWRGKPLGICPHYFSILSNSIATFKTEVFTLVCALGGLGNTGDKQVRFHMISLNIICVISSFLVQFLWPLYLEAACLLNPEFKLSQASARKKNFSQWQINRRIHRHVLQLTGENIISFCTNRSIILSHSCLCSFWSVCFMLLKVTRRVVSWTWNVVVLPICDWNF